MTHRKHSHAFGTITLTVTACLLLWGFQLPAWAGDATQVEPLALRKIMQELGRNMQAITGAISQEEWVQVVQLAQKLLHTPSHRLLKKCASLLTSALMRPSSETLTRRLTRRRWP